MKTQTENQTVVSSNNINSRIANSSIASTISSQDSGATPVVVTPGTSGAPATPPPAGPPVAGPPAGSGDAPPPPLSAADFDAIETQLNDLLTTMTNLVPDLLSRDKTVQKAQASTRGVSAAFITEAVATVQGVPDLGQLGNLDPTDARSGLSYMSTFSLFLSKLRVFEHDLSFSIGAKKAKYGAAALQVYDLTQGLARDPQRAGLSKYVDAMKKALGRSGRKKKTPTGGTTPPAGTGQPPVTPTSTTASAPVQSVSQQPGSGEQSAAPTVFITTNAPGGNR